MNDPTDVKKPGEMKRFKWVLLVACLALLLGGCATTEMNVVKQTTVDENAYSYVDIDPLVIGQSR